MAKPDWVGRIAPARRALFVVLHGVVRALRRAARLVERAAVGVLSPADLDAARDHEWAAFNVSDADVDEGLFRWERRFYDAALKPGERVLVVGCGAGRDVVALAERGFRADGVDASPGLIECARTHLARRGVNARVDVAAIDRVPSVAAYDAYVFSYFTYTLVRTADARIRALQTIARAQPRARVLISAPRSLRGGDRFSLADGNARLDYRHAFAPGELEAEVRRAGFRITRRIDDEERELVVAEP